MAEKHKVTGTLQHDSNGHAVIVLDHDLPAPEGAAVQIELSVVDCPASGSAGQLGTAELMQLARDMVEADDEAEAMRLRDAFVRGFYGERSA
jgi:hypothetical protein